MIVFEASLPHKGKCHANLPGSFMTSQQFQKLSVCPQTRIERKLSNQNTEKTWWVVGLVCALNTK